jgi:hypothetical protein
MVYGQGDSPRLLIADSPDFILFFSWSSKDRASNMEYLSKYPEFPGFERISKGIFFPLL